MSRVNILYPHKPEGRFGFDYYLNTHMPMSARLLGDAVKGMEVEKGLAGTQPGSPPAFTAMCHPLFESVDAFLAAFLPHMATLQGDIPIYTDIGPIIQFSDVALSR